MWGIDQLIQISADSSISWKGIPSGRGTLFLFKGLNSLYASDEK